MLDVIETMKQENISDIAIFLITQVNTCLVAGRKHKLPSAAKAYVWSTFHQLRNSKQVKQVWSTFTQAQIIEAHREESQLTLQLLLDRLLKQLIKNKAEMFKQKSAASFMAPLSAMECNAVRYMAGYVAISLLKKYQKPSKHPQLKVKRKIFVDILTGMKAMDQPGEPNSILDYTQEWSELVDRGGLYHINDKVGT